MNDVTDSQKLDLILMQNAKMNRKLDDIGNGPEPPVSNDGNGWYRNAFGEDLRIVHPNMDGYVNPATNEPHFPNELLGMPVDTRIDLNAFKARHGNEFGGQPVSVSVPDGSTYWRGAETYTWNLIEFGNVPMGAYYRDIGTTSIYFLSISKDGKYGFVLSGAHVAGKGIAYHSDSPTGKVALLQVSDEKNTGLVLTRVLS